MKNENWLGNERGVISKFVVIVFGVILILGVGVGTGVQLNRIGSVDSILTEGAKRVGESIRANGCVTEKALTNIQSYLQLNGIDPSRVYFNASSTREGYGSTAANGSLGYNYEIKIPILDKTVYKLYREKEIPNVQSEYVTGKSSDTSPCVGSFANFSGIQTGTTDLGETPITDVINPGVPTTVTLDGPSTVVVGETAQFSGYVDMGSTPAPQGTQVTVNAPTGSFGVSTQSNGTFTATVSFPAVGTHRVSAVSGLGTSSTNVSVIPKEPGQIVFTNAGSESNYFSIIGTSLAIQGLVTDINGNPIPSISVSVTSNTTDVPSQTINTNAKGSFSLIYTPTQLNPHQITFKVNSVTNTGTISVHQGSPKDITLESSKGGSYSSNPLTLTAGESINLRGKVLGPYNSAVTGANILISSSTNGTDNFMPNGALSSDSSGSFSNSGVILTRAGTHYIQATTGGLSRTAQVQVEVLPSVVKRVSDLQVNPQQIGAGSSVIVTGIARDAYGNPVENISLTIVGPDESTTISTGSGGVFTATLKISSPGTANLMVQSSGETLSGGIVSVNVLPTGAYTLSVHMPSDPIKAGSIATATIALKDTTGAPVQNKTLTLSLTPEEDALIQKKVTTDNNGEVVITTGTLKKAGYGSLTVTMDDVANVVGTATFEVIPGAPAIIHSTVSPAITEVYTEAKPVPLPIVSGTLTDSYANPLNGAVITVSGGFGVSVSGVTNATGYFSRGVTPTAVGGPFTVNYSVSSASGNYSTNQNTLTVTAPISIPSDKVLEGTIIAGKTGTMPNMAVRNPNGIGVGRSVALQYWTGGGATVFFKPQKGYYDGVDTWTYINIPSLIPENIKKDVNILGIMGTLQSTPTHGNQSWTSPGTYTWTVPEGVSSVLVGIYGAGGHGNFHPGGYIPGIGNRSSIGGGGGGGAFGLAFVTLTPGQNILITVGGIGAGTNNSAFGDLTVNGGGGFNPYASINELSAAKGGEAPTGAGFIAGSKGGDSYWGSGTNFDGAGGGGPAGPGQTSGAGGPTFPGSIFPAGGYGGVGAGVAGSPGGGGGSKGTPGYGAVYIFW